MNTILIANPKGGAGKTTLSINLAYLAAQDMRVSLLDMDRHNTPENGWRNSTETRLPSASAEEKWDAFISCLLVA